MFYSAEILSIRKKGKLSRCWLAATLNDRMFNKAVSKKVVMSIDIPAACDEILRGITTTTENVHHRLSLYTSAQLMYGATKLFSIQIIAFQDTLFNVKANLTPLIDLMPKKPKQKTMTSDKVTMLDPLLLPDLPPLEDLFGALAVTTDQHLLVELTEEEICAMNKRTRVESPTFGMLTDEECDFMLFGDNGDFWLIPPQSNEGFVDASREHQRFLAEASTELHDLGVSDNIQAIEQSNVVDKSSKILKTPSKRASTATDLGDTPRKKPRVPRLTEQEDATVEQTTEDFQRDFQPIDGDLPSNLDQPLGETVQLQPEMIQPIDDLPPAQDPSIPTIIPDDTNIPTVPLQPEMPEPAQRKGVRQAKQASKLKQLPPNRCGKFFSKNPTVRTHQSIVLPPPEGKRVLSAKDLLTNPSFDQCLESTHLTKCAEDLLMYYRDRTKGPFVAEIDSEISAEILRFPDMSGNQSKTAEISDRTGGTTSRDESSKNKSAVLPVIIEHNEPALGLMLPPAVPEELPEPPNVEIPLAEISNDPIPEHTSELPENAPPMEDPQDPQNGVEDSGETSRAVASNLRTIKGPDNNDSSSSANIDAFLPPRLRKKTPDERRTASHSRKSISSAEVIAEIPLSPAVSERSETESSSWTKARLMEKIELLWQQRDFATISELAPIETTKRIDAAHIFALLLELDHDREVYLTQNGTFAEIFITKGTELPSNMEWQ